MKKSTFINLILLTATVTSAQKISAAQVTENTELISAIRNNAMLPGATKSTITGSGNHTDENAAFVLKKQILNELSTDVLRNGFGQEDKHRGAEQNHDNDEKK